MTQIAAAPYGTWKSPITAEAITKNANVLEDIIVDAVTGVVYHIERRPSQAGRSVLVETRTGKDVVGADFNVRTGVQEYGGSAAFVHDSVAYCSNYADGRIYQIDLKSSAGPQAITPVDKPYRYANFALHPTVKGILVCVLEDHTNDTPANVVTSLVAVDIKAKTLKALVSGADFYALPRFSPDGTHIAWAQWFHPDMPWQGGEICVADVTPADDGRSISISNPIRIAGEKGQVAACYPLWFSDDVFTFTSDQSGFANPWKYSLATAKAEPIFPTPIDEDFAVPFWVLGMFFYAPVKGGLLFVAVREGKDVLYFVDVSGGTPPKEVPSPFVAIDFLKAVSLDEVVFAGQKADEKKAILQCSLSSLLSGTADFVKISISTPSDTDSLPSNLVSLPRPITFDLPNDGPLHVIFYPPHNPAYSGSDDEGERPPCVVNVHGGPTASVGQALDWRKQYFTSRGWAWVDVNYRGSSGYGRAYIEKLENNWGLVDTQDCISTVRLLSSAPYNLIDPRRATIRGGSAGGFTVLAAISILEKEEDRTVFAAAQSSYGVSDLQKLEEFTHKFESQYLNRLLGGTSEEVPEVYKARGPVHHIDNISTPLLILQGEIDRVVPKEQAELIYEGIKSKGGVVEYKLYPGEGHGWRREENMKDALEREIGFYERVLGLKK